MPELDTSDLRRLLDHAAGAIIPSPDAWAAIDARLDETATPDPLADGEDDGGEPTSEVLVDLGAPAPAGRSWSRRRLALAVAAVLVLVAGVVGVLVSRARPDDDGIRATNDRFPMLRDVPDGLQLQGADILPGSLNQGTSVADAALLITDTAADRGYVVTTGVRGSMRRANVPSTEITLGDRPASLLATETQASVTWDDGAQTVSVLAFGPRVDEGELRQVATGVRLSRDASLAVTLRAVDLPAGLRISYSGPARDFAPIRQSFLSWGSVAGDLDQPVDSTLTLVGFIDAQVSAAGYAGLGATRVTVAGRPGYLGYQTDDPVVAARTRQLVWSPSDGIVAMLSGTNIDDAALQRLAASVELVSESELRAFGTGWFAYRPDGDNGEPTDQVLLAEGVVDGIGWRALTATRRADGAPDQRCLLVQVAGNVGSSCGSRPSDGSEGAVLQSVQVDDRILYVVVAADDIVRFEALDPTGVVVATGDAGTTVSGRRPQVWAVVVPADVPEARVLATGPSGVHVLESVPQQSNGPSDPHFDPDQSAMAVAPTLATGTVDGSTWTLRGAMVGGSLAVVTGVGTTAPASPTPCAVLDLGAREMAGFACDAAGADSEPDMGMTAVVLLPTPRHVVLAVVEADVARYELGMADGTTLSVDAIEIPGAGGRRAVALAVDSEQRATSLTVVRTDGRRAAPIVIELSAERRSNVQFGHQGGTFNTDGGPPTTVVAADLPSLATSVPTTP